MLKSPFLPFTKSMLIWIAQTACCPGLCIAPMASRPWGVFSNAQSMQASDLSPEYQMRELDTANLQHLAPSSQNGCCWTSRLMHSLPSLPKLIKPGFLCSLIV